MPATRRTGCSGAPESTACLGIRLCHLTSPARRRRLRAQRPDSHRWEVPHSTLGCRPGRNPVGTSRRHAVAPQRGSEPRAGVEMKRTMRPAGAALAEIMQCPKSLYRCGRRKGIGQDGEGDTDTGTGAQPCGHGCHAVYGIAGAQACARRKELASMLGVEARMGGGWLGPMPGRRSSHKVSPVRRGPPIASAVTSLRMPGTGGHVGSPFTGDSHCAGQTELPDSPEVDRPLRKVRKKNPALEMLP